MDATILMWGSVLLVATAFSKTAATQEPWRLTPRQQPSSWYLLGPLAVADIDGDGFADILSGGGMGTGWGTIFVQQNLGGHGFAPEVPLYHLSDNLTKVMPSDFDRDGDIDLFILYGDSSILPGIPTMVNRLLVNDGRGRFSDETAQRWPTGAYSTMDAILVDVDRDGIDDIVECNIGQHRLFLGQPGGTYVDVTVTHMPTATVGLQIAAGDIDGVNGPDLMWVWSSFAGGFNRIYFNDGTGRFNGSPLAIPNRNNDRGCAIGDIDSDGDKDVVFAVVGLNPGPYYSQAFRNDGIGNLILDPTAIPALPIYDNHRSPVLVDVDVDGDLDILFYAANASRPLMLNDGTGHFTGVTNTYPFLVPSCMVFYRFFPADMDKDGDLDLVSLPFGCDSRSPRILHSLSRHLSAPAAPRIGQAYTVDLDGMANGAGMLALSAGSGSWPLPPYGNLMLDPASISLWPSLAVLDSTGHGTLTIPVPAASSLVGDVFYLQGLVTARPTSALHFTNAIAESIGP